MYFHNNTCLKRSTENFRLLMAGALRETCSSSGVPWGHRGPCSQSPGLCTSSSGGAKIEHSDAQCQSPGRLQAYRQGWWQQHILWAQEQQCYSSCIQQSRTVNFPSWLFCVHEPQTVIWALSGSLALYPHNNLIAFTVDIGGWFSSHLVLGYNKGNIYFKIPFLKYITNFLKGFFYCDVWLYVFENDEFWLGMKSINFADLSM